MDMYINYCGGLISKILRLLSCAGAWLSYIVRMEFIVHSLYGYIYQWHQQKNKWEGSWIVSNSKRCCYTLAVFSDGSFICSYRFHAIQYWQKQKNNWVYGRISRARKEVYILAVFPNGDFISGSGDNTIKHWQRKK